MYWNKLLVTRFFCFCFFVGIFLRAQEQEQLSFQKIEKGLFNNWISSITQDSLGFIWVGTQDGLHRYDGYRFEVLRNSPETPQSLAANWIRDLTIDANNDYWIATNGGGITKFSPTDMDFVNFSKYPKDKFLGKYASKLARLGENHVVSYSEEGFSVFNVHTNKYETLGLGGFNSLMTSRGQLLWMAHQKNQLFAYDLQTKTLRRKYTFESPIMMLEYIPDLGLLVGLQHKLILFNGNDIEKEIPLNETLTKLTHDDKGNFFMASSSSLVKFDPLCFQVKKMTSDLDVSKLQIEAIFLDRQATLWVGTDKGLYREKKCGKAFLSEGIALHARRLLNHNGTLYIGGADGLFSIKKKRQTHLIDGTSISGLMKTGDTIIAAAENGKIFKFNNDRLYKTLALPMEAGNIIKIYGLAVDDERRLWVGSWKGIYVFDKNDELLKFISLNTESNKGEAKIIDLYVDSKDRLWITTSAYGVYMVENISKTDLETFSVSIINYKRQVGNKRSLTTNIVMNYEEDDMNQMWFGSDIGVVKYDENSKDFSRLQYQGKLFDKKVMALRRDGDQNLWITTINDGIYVYKEKEKTMRHFTRKDGLISNAFLFGSGFYDAREKIMYFGTDEGIQKIDLSHPPRKNQIHTPVVTNFKVNSADGATIISPYTATFLNNISLDSDQNDFSISFSALDFTNPEKTQFAYALDDDPFKIADLQTAYFTNVPFGSHVLKVQSLYDDSIQYSNILNLAIHIKPPWYLSTLAKVLYFFLLCSAGLGIYMYFKWRWTMKLNLKLKEEEAERLKKLNDLRSKLYADIAHEFKTPLTLISGPIDSTLLEGKLSDFNRANLSMVQRNTHRLTSLVDQLLELAKLEDGQLKMKISKGDMGLLLQTICRSFEYQASLKNIKYSIDITPLEEVWFDDDVIEKIVSNLLSNAFKYTPNEGTCSFSVSKNDGQVHLSIKNTALNASNLQLEKLFTRFYQYDEHSDGMGVGLSLVKELVKVYGGSINVNMEQNEMLHFRLNLPVDRAAFAYDAIKEEGESIETTQIAHNAVNMEYAAPGGQKEERPILLIVEDHIEIRTFIKLALQKKYQILEAENGKVGMDIAFSQVPDIVLSDIRMPVQTGIELCNALKNDERTSHIPVILLTASMGEVHELSGLSSGADDYITKPFKINVLQQRLDNLVAIRAKLRNRYSQELILKPKDIAVTPSDEAFLNKVQHILDEHLSNPEFNSELFSKMANMSRMQLHRKLLAYTGLSTSAFIRSQRINHAVRILKSSDLTISEVAYTVGFNTPRYFMKCFKETFKKTPSEYLQSIDYQ